MKLELFEKSLISYLAKKIGFVCIIITVAVCFLVRSQYRGFLQLTFETLRFFLDLLLRRAEYEAEYERYMSGVDSTYTRASFVDALEGWSEDSFPDFSFAGSGDESLSSFTDWLENIDDIENLLK